jgi:hypothetical protein
MMPLHLENGKMRKSTVPALIALISALASPALAQGQGGYAPGVPGAETARMSSEERAHARALHQTNDTSGGRSSIDKSGKSFEGGDVCGQAIQGTIYRGRGGSRGRCG